MRIDKHPEGGHVVTLQRKQNSISRADSGVDMPTDSPTEEPSSMSQCILDSVITSMLTSYLLQPIPCMPML